MTKPDKNSKSIARSLGEFVGHLWFSVTRDVTSEKHEVRRTIEEEERDTSVGKVTLRRTTIDEVEIDRERLG